MSFSKLAFFGVLLSVAIGGVAVPAQAQQTDAALQERVSAMQEKHDFCVKQRDLLDTPDLRKVASDCRHFCEDANEITGKIAQGRIPPGQINEAYTAAANRCEAAHAKLSELVKAKRASMPASVSDKLGLKNEDYRNIVDKSYNRCVSEGKIVKSECDCIAEHVVSNINRSGNYPRVDWTFGRSIKQCRGK